MERRTVDGGYGYGAVGGRAVNRQRQPRTGGRTTVKVCVGQTVEVAGGDATRNTYRLVFANSRIARNHIVLHTVHIDRERIGITLDRLSVATRNGIDDHMNPQAVHTARIIGRNGDQRIAARRGQELTAVDKPRVLRIFVEAYAESAAYRYDRLFANRIGQTQKRVDIIALADRYLIRDDGIRTRAMASLVVGLHDKIDGIAIHNVSRADGIERRAIDGPVVHIPLIRRVNAGINRRNEFGRERLRAAELGGQRYLHNRFAVSLYIHIDGVGTERFAIAGFHATDEPSLLRQRRAEEQRVGGIDGLGLPRRSRGGRREVGSSRTAVIRVFVFAVAARGQAAVETDGFARADGGVARTEILTGDADAVVSDSRLVAYASRIAIEDAAVQSADTDYCIITAVRYGGRQLIFRTGDFLRRAGVGRIERAVRAVKQVPFGQTRRIHEQEVGRRTGADGIGRRRQMQSVADGDTDRIGRVGTSARTIVNRTTVVTRHVGRRRCIEFIRVNDDTRRRRIRRRIGRIFDPIITIIRTFALGNRTVERIGRFAFKEQLFGRNHMTVETAECHERKRIGGIGMSLFGHAERRIIVHRRHDNGIVSQTDGNRIGYALDIRIVSLRIGIGRRQRTADHRRHRQCDRTAEVEACGDIGQEINVGRLVQARTEFGSRERIYNTRRILTHDVDQGFYRQALAVRHLLTGIELMQADAQSHRLDIEAVAFAEQGRATVFGVPADNGTRHRSLGLQGFQRIAQTVVGIRRGRQTRQAVLRDMDVQHYIAVTHALTAGITYRRIIVSGIHRFEERAALERLAAVDTEFEQAAVFVHDDFDGRRIGRALDQTVGEFLIGTERRRIRQVTNRQRIGRGREVIQTFVSVGFRNGKIAVAVLCVVGRVSRRAVAQIYDPAVADAIPVVTAV